MVHLLAWPLSVSDCGRLCVVLFIVAAARPPYNQSTRVDIVRSLPYCLKKPPQNGIATNRHLSSSRLGLIVARIVASYAQIPYVSTHMAAL